MQEIVDEAGGGELVFVDTLVTYWDKIVIPGPAWRPDPEWHFEGGFDQLKSMYMRSQAVGLVLCSSADQTSWIQFVTFLCNGFLDGRA